MSSLDTTLDAQSAQEDVWENATTLMFRHIPRKFTGEELTNQLNSYVDPSTYDYVYVPWDRRATHNMGFAFVNFIQNRDARLAGQLMNGIEWKNDPRGRTMTVYPARMQGLYENLSWYSKMNVADPNFKHCPWVFEQGLRLNLLAAIDIVCGKSPHQTSGNTGFDAPGRDSSHNNNSRNSSSNSNNNNHNQGCCEYPDVMHRMSSDSASLGCFDSQRCRSTNNYNDCTNSNNYRTSSNTDYYDSFSNINDSKSIAFPVQSLHCNNYSDNNNNYNNNYNNNANNNSSNTFVIPTGSTWQPLQYNTQYVSSGAPRQPTSVGGVPSQTSTGRLPTSQAVGPVPEQFRASLVPYEDLTIQGFPSTQVSAPTSYPIDAQNAPSCVTVSPNSLPDSSLALLRQRLQQQHQLQRNQLQHPSPIEIEVAVQPFSAIHLAQGTSNQASCVDNRSPCWRADASAKTSPCQSLPQHSKLPDACFSGSSLVGASGADDTCSDTSSLEFADRTAWKSHTGAQGNSPFVHHSSLTTSPKQGPLRSSSDLSTEESIVTTTPNVPSYEKAWTEVNSLLLKLKERGMLADEACGNQSH